jgi:4'-phosphopantetheinyl transferase
LDNQLHRLEQFQPTVWWLRTDHHDNACQEGLRTILDEGEWARARRFVSALDRREFVACHALLRTMLSRITRRPPHEWTFSRAPNGKPSIAAEHGLSDLQFNITHTRGLVAAAVSWRHPVGVDVQIFGSGCDELDLAKRFFAASEADLVARASKLYRPCVFAQLWTLKEAYLKATGFGLSTPLDGFAFGLGPIRVQFGRGCADNPAVWQFTSSAITRHHVLSLALRVPDQQPRSVMLREVSAADLQAAIP